MLAKKREVNGCEVDQMDVLQSKRGGSRYIITERIPSFCLWRFLPPHPPARFAMPAARGKTSLNARDW